jgi:hypothetical protein
MGVKKKYAMTKQLVRELLAKDPDLLRVLARFFDLDRSLDHGPLSPTFLHQLGKKLPRIRHRFNLNGAQVAVLFRFQKERCAICGKDRQGLRDRDAQAAARTRISRTAESTRSVIGQRISWDIEHNNTGDKLVRGIVCSYCNRALGLFQHEGAIVTQALDFLRDPPAPKIIGRIAAPFDTRRKPGRAIPQEKLDRIRSRMKEEDARLKDVAEQENLTLAQARYWLKRNRSQ